MASRKKRRLKKARRRQYKKEKTAKKKLEEAQDKNKEEIKLTEQIEQEVKKFDKVLSMLSKNILDTRNFIQMFIESLSSANNNQEVIAAIRYYSDPILKDMQRYNNEFAFAKKIIEQEKKDLTEFLKDLSDEFEMLKKAFNSKQEELKLLLKEKKEFKEFLDHEDKRIKAILTEEELDKKLAQIDRQISRQGKIVEKLLDEDIKKLQEIDNKKDELKNEFKKTSDTVLGYADNLKKILQLLAQKYLFFEYVRKRNRKFKRAEIIILVELEKKNEIYKKIKLMESYELHELLEEEATVIPQDELNEMRDSL